MRAMSLLLAGWLMGTVALCQKGPEAGPDVARWKKTGARAGWMGPDLSSGFWAFTEERRAEAAKGAIPAFAVRPWKAGALTRVPPPAQPFGLDLTDSGFKDENVQE